MSDITIYHNPNCGTSRNVLALIRNTGVEPRVVQYLKTPLDKAQLQELLRALGLTARELLRQKGTPFDELGLGDSKWTDDELLKFIVAKCAHPPKIGHFVKLVPIARRLALSSRFQVHVDMHR